MRRYLHLVRLFWETSIAAAMEYRLNFMTSLVMSLLGVLGNIFALSLFYRRGYTFDGWRFEESLMVLSVFMLLNGFSSILLTPNLSRIVKHVERGTLDFILLKPMDSQFWVSTRMFSPWGLSDVVLALGMMAYAGFRLSLSPWAYVYGLLPILCAGMSLYSLWFMLAATSIWFVKIYNATEVLKGLLEAGRFPSSAFPPLYRFFFTFIVPVAFLTTVPAQVMLDRVSITWVLGAMLTAAMLFTLARGLWSFALRFYTSASS